jgi:hypothetical protein
MKNSTTENSSQGNLIKWFFFILLSGFFSSVSYAQEYRSIDAYLDDFGKNELYVKKAIMDYSMTIVESQMYSRTKYTAERIIDKLENMNAVLRTTDKGFENNTQLRDSFMKMNQKTIDCLSNGTLILNDYVHQSTLPLAEIEANFNQKEKELISYFQELKNYDESKNKFAACYHMQFRENKGKNILEYNAYQNMLFYKMNVVDEKLSAVIAARDKKGFMDCLNMIDKIQQEVIAKTTEYRSEFNDNSLNNANILYATFLANQKTKLNDLFIDYVAEHNALQQLKNAPQSNTKEAIDTYNYAVRGYNNKKNLFYAVFNDIQTRKKISYNNWYVVNSNFLKNNGQFDNIYEKYAYSK